MCACIISAVQADVQKDYLLPDGTVRVLKYIEKDNPRNARLVCSLHLTYQSPALLWCTAPAVAWQLT
jgi:hypothetical protein